MQLGVGPYAVRMLQTRWRIWEAHALEPQATKRAFSFELTCAIVARFQQKRLAGYDPYVALASLDPADHPPVPSDQGVHDRRRTWQTLLTAAGATASMSRKGVAAIVA